MVLVKQSHKPQFMLSSIIHTDKTQEYLNSIQQPFQEGDFKDAVKKKLKLYVEQVKKLDKLYDDMKISEYDEDLSMQVFRRLVESFRLLTLHFAFLVEIIDSESGDQLPSIFKRFEDISNLYVDLKKNLVVSLSSTHDVLETIVKVIFEDFESSTNCFFIEKENKRHVNQDKETISQAQIIISKIEATLFYLPSAAGLSKDHLFAQPKSSDVWTRLYNDVRFKQFADKKDIDADIKKFGKLVALVNAVIYKSHQSLEKNDNKAIANVIGTLSGLYYTTQLDKAETRASLYFSDPKMESAFKFWNLPDKKWVKGLYKLRFPSVEYDRKIYVSRLFPVITRETILKEYNENTLHTIKHSGFVAPNLSNQKEEILKNIFDKRQPGRVKIRVISSKQLVIRGKKREKLRVMMSNIKQKLSSQENHFKDEFKGVIIHIHGGGFVSMSSSSHRNYLNLWAKSLNMVIFSIDYRLAPENQYPDALDDVWQAYNWIINYSESILSIPLDRIVLTGDSAGGNISMALTLRLIKEGVRLPDGVLLSYPALNLYPEDIVPSYFIAINDVILPYNVLKLCLQAYMGEGYKPQLDPYLSPIHASDEFLSKMPPVRIISGTNDPLHDDIWRLMQKLQNLGKEVKATIYEGVPHGFLSLDEMKGYELMIAESVGRIRELFYTVDKK